jgi:ribosomal protein S7
MISKKNRFVFFNKGIYPSIDRTFLNFLTFKIFLGKLIKKGKRKKAFNILAKVFYILKRKLPRVKYVFFYIVYTLMPILKLINKRVGGVIYRLPIAVTSPKMAISMAIKSLILHAAKRKEKKFYLKLAAEMIDTYKKKSSVYKSKIESYTIAVSNLPFLHYLRKRKGFNNRYSKYKYRKKFNYKMFNSFKKPIMKNTKFLTFIRKNNYYKYKKKQQKRLKRILRRKNNKAKFIKKRGN